jgi:hypothetical protein
VTLVVGQGAERHDLGIWSAAEGGGVGGDPSLHYPGAMRPPVSLGSDVETEALTLRKLEADLTDDDLAFLLDIVGSATPAVGSRQRLDARNKATRRPMLYTGTISNVNPSDVDSTSSDPALIEVVLAVTGKPQLVA